MNRFICIHGHFYQPPRENPWLETVEREESASPFHDWNERITAECYTSNARSRIQDPQGRILRMVNNYARISFNMGPTLLSWLEKKAPDTYAAILQADRDSRDRFGGHGSALAQAYNHMILPLANQRDKETQILWGIEDFLARFGRRPEGMWLPETAVDIPSLEILAREGIAFTILEPFQARRVRALGQDTWEEVTGGRIDTGRAYRCDLPSGRSLALFFYDAPISRAIAFEKLLDSGEILAKKLLSAFDPEEKGPRLVHVATDGETYGHHHRFGDMALAYALESLGASQEARLTNYAEFLDRFPPRDAVEIIPGTSWSCSHGVERWRGDCSCSTGAHPGWHQAWRGPLRRAMDTLRDRLAVLYEEEAAPLIKDPWQARDAYIACVLDRSEAAIRNFFGRVAKRDLLQEERIRALKLLEMQRHAMLMFTSCGWFFDDIGGIETIQIILYAARAIQLAKEIRPGFEEGSFTTILGEAPGNTQEYPDAKVVYETRALPAVLDLAKVCAHEAISSLFQRREASRVLHCYRVEVEHQKHSHAGKTRLIVKKARVKAQITLETQTFCCGVLHLGDHSLTCGVVPFKDEATYAAIVADLGDTFARGDLPNTLRAMDRHFAGAHYSLKDLFHDDQGTIIESILKTTLQDMVSVYRNLYEDSAPLLRFLKSAGIRAPQALSLAAEFVLNASLMEAWEREIPDSDEVAGLLDQVKSQGLTLNKRRLGFRIRKTLERLCRGLGATAPDTLPLQRFLSLLALTEDLPFPVDLWDTQTVCYDWSRTLLPGMAGRALREPEAVAWVSLFKDLARRLSILLPE